jgi:hypothetical protein
MADRCVNGSLNDLALVAQSDVTPLACRLHDGCGVRSACRPADQYRRLHGSCGRPLEDANRCSEDYYPGRLQGIDTGAVPTYFISNERKPGS